MTRTLNTFLLKVSASLLCLVCVSCFASTSVWIAEKDGRQLYLGGTIHLLKPKDFPLPSAFEEAYQKSDMLVLEASMDDFQTPEMQHFWQQQMLLPGNQMISELVSEQTMDKLSQYFQNNQVNMAQLSRYKAGFIGLNMALIEFRKMGFSSEGVDAFYLEKAKSDNKALEYLESAKQQVIFLSEMGLNDEDKYFHYTFEDLKTLPDTMDTMVNSWRTGDMALLERTAITPMQENYPQIYKSLLVDRNHRWIDVITKLHDTPEVEFILAGALHFAGDDGVLTLLEKQGFTISKWDQ